MNSRVAVVSLLCLLFVGWSGLSTADSPVADWPQYRGPDRDGISHETDLTKSWGKSGPPELWRRPIGPAFAGISIVAGRLYTMESDSNNEYASCLDVETGDELWRTVVGPTFEDSFGNGPRSTPTVDGDVVYVVSSVGNFSALSVADGHRIWTINFPKAFESEIPGRGFTGSVLIVDDFAIVEPGGTKGRAIAAFDKSTGELRWTSSEGPAGYSSPLIVDFEEVRQLVFVRPNALLGLTPSGQVLWTHNFAPDVSTKIAMPVFVAPDLLFFSASYDAGSITLRMKKSGDSIAVEEVWQNRVMRNHFNSSVAVDGKLYGFDNATFKCIDGATGEQHWAKRGGMGKGSLIYGDGDLIVLTENGKLLLVEATPEKYIEKGGVQVLQGRSWTAPTLAGGTLFLRNLEELVSIRLKG